MNLEAGKTYQLTFPTGDKVICRLERIETYSTTGMPPDYLFKYISGEERFAKASKTPGVFPIPAGLLPKFTCIEEIESGLALFDQLEGKLKTKLIYEKGK